MRGPAGPRSDVFRVSIDGAVTVGTPDHDIERINRRSSMEHSRIDPGLCATCSHCKLVRSDRGSTFYRCTLSDQDSRFAKYPRLPVLTCVGWKLKAESTATATQEPKE